jgi:hypothetical protein
MQGYLGILAAGDFTKPASALVKTRNIDLFLVPKGKVIEGFRKHGLQMDYPDKLPEEQKAQLADAFQRKLTPLVKAKVAATLHKLIGSISINTYVDRVRAALGAQPQELRFIAQHQSKPVTFESILEATEFLNDPEFDLSSPIENFIYEITYSDGSEFERPVATLKELRELHTEIEYLARHMATLTAS